MQKLLWASLGFFAVVEAESEPQVPPLRYPGFPVELGGVDELHAAFLNGKPHTWMWVRTA
jgi:hypothetical protein